MNKKSYTDGFERQPDGSYRKPAKEPGYLTLPVNLEPMTLKDTKKMFATSPDMKFSKKQIGRAMADVEQQLCGVHNITNTAKSMLDQIAPPNCADLKLVISGQIRGGKNNITVTRSGRRFPNKQWAAWRDAAVREIKSQLPAQWKAIGKPVNVRLDYVAENHRRRDFPAICDAVWHVMEKAGVVTDDTFLWPSESSRSYSKEQPRCEITFHKQP